MIWNFFLGMGEYRFNSFQCPRSWNRINYLIHFRLLSVTYFGAFWCGLHSAGCFTLQPWGLKFVGHCGLWDSLYSLLGWLWQWNKETCSESPILRKFHGLHTGGQLVPVCELKPGGYVCFQPGFSDLYSCVTVKIPWSFNPLVLPATSRRTWIFWNFSQNDT